MGTLYYALSAHFTVNGIVFHTTFIYYMCDIDVVYIENKCKRYFDGNDCNPLTT